MVAPKRREDTKLSHQNSLDFRLFQENVDKKEHKKGHIFTAFGKCRIPLRAPRNTLHFGD
jgi:hypothetical protein